MYKAGKINNAVTEIVRLYIDIMRISKMRWIGNGQCIVDDHKLYHSSNENKRHIYGVALIISRRMRDYIKHIIPVSERIRVIQLIGNSMNINIV